MSDFTPAKRGCIAVTEKATRGYSLIAGSFSHLRVTVGVVESVTREGTVKRVKPADSNAAPMTPRDWDSITLIKPDRLANVDGFLAECAARQSTNPDTWRPFESLNDVRETARKYL